MSMPLKTSAESTLMISAFKACAKATDKPVLPAHVGPINSMAGGFSNACIIVRA
jgi:hypothetical protein